MESQNNTGAIDATGWTEVKQPEPQKTAPISADGWTEVHPVTQAPIHTIKVNPETSIPEYIPPSESVATSAIKDIKQAPLSIIAPISQGITDIVKTVSPFTPVNKNPLVNITRGIMDEYEKGTLGEDALNVIKTLWSPVTRLGDIASGIISRPSEAPSIIKEQVLRRPASFAMDVTSVMPMLKAGIGIGGKVAKYGTSLASGKSIENISARIANSKAIQEARPPEIIAKDIPGAFKTLEDKIISASENATKLLSKDAAHGYPASAVAEIVDEIKAPLKPIGKSAKSAISALESIKQDVLGVYKGKATTLLGPNEAPISTVYSGDNISPFEIKELLRRLDKDVDWDTVDMSNEANDKLRQVRGSLNAMLKLDNPEYAQAMEPVQRLIRKQEAAKEALGVKRIQGKYDLPQNIERRLAALKNNFKKNEIEALDEFGHETGLHIPNEVENYTIQQDFKKGSITGARKTAMGAAGGTVTGLAIGHPAIGAGIGGVAGAALDLWGGRLAAAGIDAANPIFKGVTKFADIIPPETSVAILLNGVKKEKEGHPQLTDEQAVEIAAQELNKNPKSYEE